MRPPTYTRRSNRSFGTGTDDRIPRREFLHQSAAWTIRGLAGSMLAANGRAAGETRKSTAAVHTVLGPVAAEKLGVTLMHEHAPLVDWSELYESPVAPIAAVREQMLSTTARLLDAFHNCLGEDEGPGAIVECTPIRVGRYPQLLVELAKRTRVQIIACTGFWCEAFAPQHPWAVQFGVEKGGVKKMADLYIREITEGMEDPAGEWGQRFTTVKAGIIKCATSKYLRPSERRCHLAAAIASKQTGCPITTHTTDGGGLEEVTLFLKQGVNPEKVIIGHQGNQDDREHESAHEYHRRIVSLGSNVQFDRVGHEKYTPAKTARQVKSLVDAGYVKQVLVGHDHVPFFYEEYTAAEKTVRGWKAKESDYTIVPTELVEAMKTEGISPKEIRTILAENPRRILSF